jgi:hypothetical protein
VIRPMKHRVMMAKGLFRRNLLGMADDIVVVCVVLFCGGGGKERKEICCWREKERRCGCEGVRLQSR